MTVNEKIKKSLKSGDVQRIADLLETSHQNVSKKLNSDKEIDSVNFINAVCEVTKKPFSHFIKLNSTYAISEEEMANMVSDSDEQYMNTRAAESNWVHYRKEYYKARIQRDLALRIPKMTMDEIIQCAKELEAKVNIFDEDEISRLIVEVYSLHYNLEEGNSEN